MYAYPFNICLVLREHIWIAVSAYKTHVKLWHVASNPGNKLRWYPQQPWIKWPQILLNLTWLCAFSETFSGTLLNLTWLCAKASLSGTLLNLTWLCTKASQTFSGTFSGTLLNLPGSASKPPATFSGIFSGTSLNLTRRLHQCTPELFWAEDPISLRWWGKVILASNHFLEFGARGSKLRNNGRSWNSEPIVPSLGSIHSNLWEPAVPRTGNTRFQDWEALVPTFENR